MIFYLNLGFTLRDFSAEVQSYQPFIDRNHNGIHDVSYYESIPSNNDFPGAENSPDPFLTQFQGFYNPIELTLGVNVKYSSNISLVCESGLWNNDSNISDKLFVNSNIHLVTPMQNQFNSNSINTININNGTVRESVGSHSSRGSRPSQTVSSALQSAGGEGCGRLSGGSGCGGHTYVRSSQKCVLFLLSF